jgi:hypothetical protein
VRPVFRRARTASQEPNKCLIYAENFGEMAHLKADSGLDLLSLFVFDAPSCSTIESTSFTSAATFLWIPALTSFLAPE